MTAKEMKKRAKLTRIRLDGEGNIVEDKFYQFTPAQMDAFTAQLLREQREICSRMVRWPNETLTESEIEERVLTAPAPDGFGDVTDNETKT